MIRIQGWPKLRNTLILLYSLVVITTILPSVGKISNAVVLPYYVLIPGYAISMVLRQTEGIVQTLFFSVIWSVAILVSISSITTVAPSLSSIPLSGIVPVLTIVLTVYSYYHGR